MNDQPDPPSSDDGLPSPRRDPGRPESRLNQEIFLSFSSKDQAACDFISQRLADEGRKPWWCVPGIKPGQDFTEEIVKSLDAARCFILLLSANATQSKWVNNEVTLAFNRHNNGRLKSILVFRLDNVNVNGTGLELPLARLQKVNEHVGDWKDDVEALLRAVREVFDEPSPISEPPNPNPNPIPTTTVPVRIPPFHYGSVVPLDYFIDRENELRTAREYIATRQSFLIVGHRRAGKSSFGQKLIHLVMSDGLAKGSKILGCYLDLQQYSILDVNRFLAHTLLNLIGEVARQVFYCKFTTLSRRNPFSVHPELQQDAPFNDLLHLYQAVVKRTHTSDRATPAELRQDEFEGYINDLVEILRHKGWSDLFIFYDEANRLPLDLSVEFLTWNVGALNRAGIVSIYAASPEMAEKFQDWSDREIRIGPFLSVEDMLRLLAKYYFGDSSSTDTLPVASEAIVRIWELSEGVPYLIQQISGRSFAGASKEGSKWVEERHVREAHDELRSKRPEIFRN